MLNNVEYIPCLNVQKILSCAQFLEYDTIKGNVKCVIMKLKNWNIVLWNEHITKMLKYFHAYVNIIGILVVLSKDQILVLQKEIFLTCIKLL